MGILIVAIGRHCDRDNDPPLGRIATRPGRGSGARDGAHPVQNLKMIAGGVHGRNVGAPAANVNLRDPCRAVSVFIEAMDRRQLYDRAGHDEER